MAEINIQQATARPANLKLVSPKLQEPEATFIERAVPNQSWSTVMALNFIMEHENDLRDNAVLADVIASTISATISGGVTQDDLDEFYAESIERRGDIDLEAIDETTYKNQRDPTLLRNFVASVLIGSGVEEELAEDLVEAVSDDRIVAVVDDAVGEQRELGSAAETEARAEEIAQKLGLQRIPSDLEEKNLIISGVFVTDSTDSYVKKVIK